METKCDAAIHLRLPSDVRRALERAAAVDRRTLSSMAVKLIADALESGGWLRPTMRTTKRG